MVQINSENNEVANAYGTEQFVRISTLSLSNDVS